MRKKWSGKYKLQVSKAARDGGNVFRRGLEIGDRNKSKTVRHKEKGIDFDHMHKIQQRRKPKY